MNAWNTGRNTEFYNVASQNRDIRKKNTEYRIQNMRCEDTPTLTGEGGRNTDFGKSEYRIRNTEYWIQNTEYRTREGGRFLIVASQEINLLPWPILRSRVLSNKYLLLGDFWTGFTCWQVSWRADAAIEYASLRLRVRTPFPVCL